MKSFFDGDETFLIDGAYGKLEMLTSRPAVEKQMTAIICHPHPLYGGTMSNKVVTTLAKTFDQLGVKTVRFNFRGVGRSEGIYDDGIGETDDLRVILTRVKEICPDDVIWLAGFSFGSYVAAKAADGNPDIAKLITVAPAVNHFNYESLTHIACPWLLIAASDDDLVPLPAIQDFVDNRSGSIQFLIIQEAGHFFHGRLVELRDTLIRELT